MKNIEMQISKKVISFNEGNLIGFILDICFDDKLKNFIGYIVCDEETGEELFLACEKVVAENNECIFINSAEDTEINFSPSFNPIGKSIYDKKGVYLGKVKSVIVRGKVVDKLITEIAEIRQKYIYSNGKFIIFSQKRRKNLKIFKKNEKINNYPKIEIMSKKPQVTLPTRLITSPEQILNRIATRDIFGLNNELIIKKGDVITQNKLEKAKKHNKISFLLFNSK